MYIHMYDLYEYIWTDKYLSLCVADLKSSALFQTDFVENQAAQAGDQMKVLLGYGVLWKQEAVYKREDTMIEIWWNICFGY